MTSKVLSTSDIPEVQKFLEVQARLDKFKHDNPVFFQYLEELTNEYNDTLQEAERAVRIKDVTCGPFNRYQEQTKYFPEQLYELMGRDKFLELGGTETRVVVRELDKKHVDLNIANGRIPEDVANEVRKTTGKYKVPKIIGVP